MRYELHGGVSSRRRSQTERRVFRVAELTTSIRNSLEGKFGDVWVEGEVSNFRPHSSGHWYFTLKDDDAQLRAVMFRSQVVRMRFRPKDGQQVLCGGRLTVYERRGEYQLVLQALEPRGSGALLLAFEELKSRLEREGLFAAERKRPLPRLPQRIGIVTSPTGAAVRDLLEVIGRRDPQMSILICPAQVQGVGASIDIADAIRRLGRSGRVDVIIAGRGGGSIEDLWAFNEEIVARAIASCPVPVVSAVGHEVDFTISDFVADVRAPTPSAAAEIVVPQRSLMVQSLEGLRARAARALHRRIAESRHRLGAVRGRIEDPRRVIVQRRLALDEWTHRCARAMRDAAGRSRARLGEYSASLRERHPAVRLARWHAELSAHRGRLEAAAAVRLSGARSRFNLLTAKLDGLSPLAVLRRGYAVARKPDGTVIADSARVGAGDEIEILLGKGRLEVQVARTFPDEHSADGGLEAESKGGSDDAA